MLHFLSEPKFDSCIITGPYFYLAFSFWLNYLFIDKLFALKVFSYSNDNMLISLGESAR